ncbi:glycosyltransferase family 4 protein [Rhizobium sp. CC-YZS058]|uniref:glycosyltransferase family 4 protein n=1 Tax=Rhizobium sp. CC-YZS058 TaxID=3042153 RepID=UPI002B05D8AC|nr:glycosyltransferase family 4 protein [Rhizobium sp. CC-YZS058]MEA3535457.1 glycosyltransferase family 4 protein [Rhizobium sp. CC-YZS058]
MTSALFVSHTAKIGGAELFLVDLLEGGPPEWRACFLGQGAAADRLTASGRPPIVLQAGARMLAIRRESSLPTLAAGAADVFAVARQLARQARSFDVICANSQKALFVCSLASKLSRRPMVWFLHDIITDPAFSSVNRRAALYFARHFATRVAVNSQASADAFIRAGGQAEKVDIVYNGFDPAAAKPHQAARGKALRAELGLDDRPIIGLFGRLSPWKGQHVLLQALAKCPDVQAVIVGAAMFGEDAYAQSIRSLAAELDLENRVRFLGFRTDVPDLIAATDIVVHSSTVPEPFGRVVVEGMMAGRPVIATEGGGVSEIVRRGETGWLVPPEDPAALVEVIRDVLADPLRAARLADAGRLDVSRRFSLEETRTSMARVLHSAARS